jgi:hypothetical protein
VRESAAAGIAHVIIDLRGLTLMDISGVDLLTGAVDQLSFTCPTVRRGRL